jgi:hypothetical protein
MKEKLRNNFLVFSKQHGVDSAIVLISSETLITAYGGTLLFEMGLYYLIPPLAFIPVSLFSTFPFYMIVKKLVRRSLL